MAASILTSTKHALGIAEDYTVFDADILMFINTVFSTLNQIGVGPADGLMITDATATWDALSTDKNMNMVQTYVYLKVRLLFDPPTMSYVLDAMKEQITQMEWRMNVVRESQEWVDPDPISVDSDYPIVLDGGLVT